MTRRIDFDMPSQIHPVHGCGHCAAQHVPGRALVQGGAAPAERGGGAFPIVDSADLGENLAGPEDLQQDCVGETC
jgi:hypothetical protein